LMALKLIANTLVHIKPFIYCIIVQIETIDLLSTYQIYKLIFFSIP
jgi:hypothetical protein